MGKIEQHYRADGYLSAVMGGRDRPLMGSDISPLSGLGARGALETLYLSSGLASTIVDRPAEDALARGVKLEGDVNNRLSNELDRLDVIRHLTLALRMALLHGAAALLPLMDDSPSMAEPINPEGLMTIREVRAISGAWISRDLGVDQNALSANFGRPMHYLINFPGALEPVRVHWTRLIPVPGEGSDLSSATETVPWQGKSVLAGAWKEFFDYRDVCQWAIRVLERKQQPVYKMKELADMLMMGTEGEELVQKRIQAVDSVRNLLRTVVVDSEDEFRVTDLSLSGLDSVINEFRISLAAAGKVPVAVLFGETPKGLGATGSGDMAVYESRVGQLRTNSAMPAFERLMELITSQRGTRWPRSWKVCSQSVWEPTEKEKAETAEARARARKAEIESLLALLRDRQITALEFRTALRMLMEGQELSETPPPGAEQTPEPSPAPRPQQGNPA